MKTITLSSLLLVGFTCCTGSLAAQGWVGGNGGSTNNLSAVNTSLSATPINVGIGTLTPAAQLHTTGSLRFAGLTQNNALNQVLVSDVSGNVSWRDVASIAPPPLNNAWLLNGNAGTNSLNNYLGTSDNQALILKTNNIQRMSISNNLSVGNRNVSYVDIGRQGVANELTSLNVWSRDVVGFSMPFFISSDVAGMNWNFTAGADNTLGRLIRLNQGNTAANGGNDFYDFGIDNSQDFYITERTRPGTNAFPQRMFTIDSRNRVGINMGWGVRPTAIFHTIGTVRHENLPFGAGAPLVIDAAGNIYRGAAIGLDIQQEAVQDMSRLKKEMAELRKELDALKDLLQKVVGNKQPVNPDNGVTLRVVPNPSSGTAEIRYSVPATQAKIILRISTVDGRPVKELAGISGSTQHQTLNETALVAGTYFCTLLTDGQIADTYKFVVAK